MMSHDGNQMHADKDSGKHNGSKIIPLLIFGDNSRLLIKK